MPVHCCCDGGGGTPAATVFAESIWFGDSFELPDSADWQVNAAAPSVADTLRTAEVVSRHDDTTIEGRGLTFQLPAGTTQLQVVVRSWAETAPAAQPRTVGFALFARPINAGAAVPAAWIATTAALADISITSTVNRFVIVTTYTILYTAFATALVAGGLYHFEFTRPAPAAGTELVGDHCVRSVSMRGVA